MKMLTTHTKQELQRKAAILKQHETYAYQAAYYLVEDEALAAEAATKALIAILQDESFFQLSEQLQHNRVKQAVMKQALLTKAAVLQPSM
ncbi:hypothetical protein [Paenibacillus sp. PL91]|uniref:hypothetical protein n=1 Tax=Paenibacillus sp. PL91 TaxID=2729538 RepID=UPI00145F1979|nr:hypothetical protein [Paenibacillus sp. PL91]MBC9203805.1 hypothetical protein [Paenibacillus sp. PL91]